MIEKVDYELTLKELKSQLLQNGLQRVVLEAGIVQLENIISDLGSGDGDGS